MRNVLVVLGMVASVSYGTDFDPATIRNPIGEKASYKLVRNLSRTSAVITRGGFNVDVLKEKMDGTNKVYETHYKYALKVLMSDDVNGEGTTDAPDFYFSEQFREKLRKAGEIQLKSYKMRFLGIEDATIGKTRHSEGLVFKGCDKILIYDLKEATAEETSGLTSAFVPASFVHGIFQNVAEKEELTARYRDTKIYLVIAKDIPVFGAVKADLQTKRNGMQLKLGFDIILPKTIESPKK